MQEPGWWKSGMVFRRPLNGPSWVLVFVISWETSPAHDEWENGPLFPPWIKNMVATIFTQERPFSSMRQVRVHSFSFNFKHAFVILRAHLWGAGRRCAGKLDGARNTVVGHCPKVLSKTEMRAKMQCPFVFSSRAPNNGEKWRRITIGEQDGLFLRPCHPPHHMMKRISLKLGRESIFGAFCASVRNSLNLSWDPMCAICLRGRKSR